MIKQIVQHSSKLIEFPVLLQLNLSKPQTRHVLRITDAVIVSEAPYKTLATLYDIIVDAPDASNGADFLRISPWEVEEDLSAQQRAFVIEDLKQLMGESGERVLYVSIDDSLTEKDKDTRHLQPVDFHHDHTKSSGRKQAYTLALSSRLQTNANGSISFAPARVDSRTFRLMSVYSSAKGTVGTNAPSISCAPICRYRHSRY